MMYVFMIYLSLFFKGILCYLIHSFLHFYVNLFSFRSRCKILYFIKKLILMILFDSIIINQMIK
jgi:hypothetical protein